MGVADTVDPLAGSYYVENMTDEVEDKAFEYIARIDDMGGALSALDRGYQVAEIHESAFRPPASGRVPGADRGGGQQVPVAHAAHRKAPGLSTRRKP